MHHTLLAVATLLATVAFEASIRPPGGLIMQAEGGDKSHQEGESIMAIRYPKEYKVFITCNTISFITSLSVIMLLISALHLKRLRITSWMATPTMCVAIASSAVTYALSTNVSAPDNKYRATRKTLLSAVLAWVGLMALLFLCYVLCLVRNVRKPVHKASTNQKLEDLMV